MAADSRPALGHDARFQLFGGGGIWEVAFTIRSRNGMSGNGIWTG